MMMDTSYVYIYFEYIYTLNILLPNFVAFLVLPGTATSFIEKKFFFRNVNVTGRHLVLLGGE